MCVFQVKPIKPVVWSPSSTPQVLFQSDEWMKDTHYQLKFTGQDILSSVIVLLWMDGWTDGRMDTWMDRYRHSRGTPHQISKRVHPCLIKQAVFISITQLHYHERAAITDHNNPLSPSVVNNRFPADTAGLLCACTYCSVASPFSIDIKVTDMFLGVGGPQDRIKAHQAK